MGADFQPRVGTAAEAAAPLELLVQLWPHASVSASNADVPCLPSTLPDHVNQEQHAPPGLAYTKDTQPLAHLG